MAAAPEARLWGWLKSGLKRFGSQADVSRIETSTELGYPDVEGCISGGSFLCELKVAHHVTKDGRFSLPHFTAIQAYKLHRRHIAGGRAYLLVRVGDDHFLVGGSHVLDVQEQRMSLSRPYLSALAEPVGSNALPHFFWREMAGLAN